MTNEEQLQKRIDELEKELAHILAYLKIVGQELRIPLVPMKGFVRSLLDDENEEWYTREDRREFYSIIDENIDRLSRISNEFQMPPTVIHSSLEMNWQKNVDVREILERTVTIQQGGTDLHQIILDFESAHIEIDTDPGQLTLIFHNLIRHAIKYSPNGGEIKIVGRLEPPTKKIPCKTLLINIHIPGAGLSKAQLEAIRHPRKFIKFHPDNISQGIFLVRHLINGHGGSIELDSKGIDKGTTTIVRIPVRQTEEAKVTKE